jgi:hypothetical protein
MTFTTIIPVKCDGFEVGSLNSVLDRCIEAEIPVIVILDGEDEHKLNLVSQQLRKNFQIIEIKGHFGSAGAARNQGLSLVQTQYVTFWDADDKPIIDAYIEMARVAMERNLDFVIGGIKFSNNETGRIKNYFPNKKLLTKPWLLFSNPGFTRILYKTQILGEVKFGTEPIAEDVMFLYSLTPMKNFEIYPEIVYIYNTGLESQATNSQSVKENLHIALDKAIRIYSSSQKINEYSISMLTRVFASFIAHKHVLRNDYKNILVTTKKLASNPKITFEVIREIIGLRFRHKPIRLYMSGGFGNQLFQIVYAVNNKIDNFIFDFKTMQPNLSSRTKSQFHAYNLENQIFPKSDKNHLTIKGKYLILLLKLSSIDYYPAGRIRRFITFLVKVFLKNNRSLFGIQVAQGISKIPLIPLDKKLSGVIGSFHTSSLLTFGTKKELLSIFTPRVKNQTLENYWLKAQKTQPTLLHIRLGDYLQIKELNIVNLEYFKRSLKYINDIKEISSIWLFSNDLKLATSYIPIEFRHKIEIVDSDEFEVYETFELMRMCKNFVISNSTLSWWAAQLSYHDFPVVVAPYPWYRSKSEDINFIPKNWVRIKYD